MCKRFAKLPSLLVVDDVGRAILVNIKKLKLINAAEVSYGTGAGLVTVRATRVRQACPEVAVAPRRPRPDYPRRPPPGVENRGIICRSR
jgi:hypothetical protein